MRIIFLESVHNFGGATKSTLELAERLISVGHQVLIVDFWGCSISYVEECHKKNIPLQIIDKQNTPILLNVKSKVDTIRNYARYLRTLQFYKREMATIIEEFDPEIISVNNTKTLSILSSVRDYKIAYFARNWFLPNTISFIDKRLLKSKVDIFLTVSQATKQMIYAGGYGKLSDIYVVQNAINLQSIKHISSLNEYFVPWHHSNDRPFVMLHCGTFVETKGQHIALQVLKKLVQKKIKVKLMLIGFITKSYKSKDYYETLRRIIVDNGLVNHVEFVLNESDVLPYFTKSDVLIHPSYSEGLPRVVLEAMAFGKPVIGNAVGGMTDFVLNNYTGYLTNFNSINEYVDFLELMINDRSKYQFISENALNLIKYNYSEENQLNAFQSVINSFNNI